MLPIYDGAAVTEAPATPSQRRPPTKGQADLHSADGVRQRARVCQRLPRDRAGGGAHAALRQSHARTGRAVHVGRRMLSGEGDGGRLHEGGGEPGDRQQADRAVHADGAGSVPLRAIRAVPAADSGCQRVRRSRDPFAHQPECVRRPGHAGRRLRAHGLARAAGGRPAAEAAADVASLRREARRQRADVRGFAGRSLRARWSRRPPSPACNCRRCAIAWCAAATVSASWKRGATGRSR